MIDQIVHTFFIIPTTNFITDFCRHSWSIVHVNKPHFCNTTNYFNRSNEEERQQQLQDLSHEKGDIRKTRAPANFYPVPTILAR